MWIAWLVNADAVSLRAPTLGALRDSPPLSLTLMMAFTCCAIGLVVAVLVLGFVAATSKQKSTDHSVPDGERHE